MTIPAFKLAESVLGLLQILSLGTIATNNIPDYEQIYTLIVRRGGKI